MYAISKMRGAFVWVVLLTLLLSAAPLAVAAPPAQEGAIGVLRLATTTSTADSGLLDFILPAFEQADNAKVDVIAVGTGQALEIGSRGDADVVLVHARAREDQFVAEGHARERFDVMYNDFVVVGPIEDPARVSGMLLAADAFKAIAESKSAFASRGDDSGTHTKEMSLWNAAGITPGPEMGWYKSLGQGMGDTLLFASEQQAYALTDRGTFLSMRDKLPGLTVVVGGNSIDENKDRNLLNPYGIMAINPDQHPGVDYDLAMQFVEWFISFETQEKIAEFGVEKFGQPLFYPDSDEFKATREVTVKVGEMSKTYTLEDLKAFPSVTIADIEFIGHKKGPLGKDTWTGASLKEILLDVAPTLSDPGNAEKLIVVTASDGWVSRIRWNQLFGEPAGGEALADSYGCTECHGMYGEGTAPPGRKAIPPLAGKEWNFGMVEAILRTPDAHSNLNPFTEEQLSDVELEAIMNWFADPNAPATDFVVDESKRTTLLAYERNGSPMTGRDGLIQLVMGMDKYTSRFAHWVKTIEVQ